MSSCSDIFIHPQFRVVQTILERNTIPCDERIRGMVVVVNEQNFKTYQLKEGDICNNNNWKDITVDETYLGTLVGHKTEEQPSSQTIDNSYFDNKYPKAIEGFRVTIKSLNTTFMKLNDGWVMYGTFKYLEDE